MTWTPVQKLSIGAGSALLVLALFGLVAFSAVTRLVEQQSSVAEANEAVEKLSIVLVASEEAERATTAYLLSGDERGRVAFGDARSHVEDALDVLVRRSEDDPRQRAALDSLTPILAERFSTLGSAVLQRVRYGADSAAAFLAVDQQRSRTSVLHLVQRLRDAELRRLAERTRQQSERGALAGNFMLAGSLIAFILAAMALTPVRPAIAARLTQRLTTPIGMSAIPELSGTKKDATRLTSDRLSRLQQVIFALERPANDAAVGTVLLERGVSMLRPAAALVARLEGDAWHVIASQQTRVGVGSALGTDVSAPFRDVLASGEPVAIESVAEREKLYPGLASLGHPRELALLVVPLTRGGAVCGALALAFAEGRVFGDDERTFVSTLGRVGGRGLAIS